MDTEADVIQNWKAGIPGTEKNAKEVLEKNPLDYEANYVCAISDMPDFILQHNDLMKYFKKDQYDERMQSYEEACLPVLEALDRAAAGRPEQRDILIKDCAFYFIERLSDAFEEKKQTSGRKKAEAMQMDARMGLALYAVPMIRKQTLEGMEELADAIVEAWKNKYPKQAILKGDYNEISHGFKKKRCFITSAVCRSLKKDDDCYELTMFRHFRDEYLQRQPGGNEIIEQYYETAPRITAFLDLCQENGPIYQGIWDGHLCRCLKELEAGHYRECLNGYMKMVLELKRQYLCD